MTDDARTVVIGVGSPLMGDDGLGVAALEVLRESWTFDPPVDLLDGGTWGMNLLPFIEAADRVVILDAVQFGTGSPGGLVRLERQEIPRFFAMKLSPHQIDLKEVLALAELRGTLPAATIVLGIRPAKIEMSAELSGPVRRSLPGLLAAVVAQLAAWGHEGTVVGEAAGVVEGAEAPETPDGAPDATLATLGTPDETGTRADSGGA